MSQQRITDDLQALVNVIPPTVADSVAGANNSDNLIEVVMDLGRRPMARFTDGERELSSEEVARADIDYVVTRIGDFDADNRAGLERTLHRISGIRNRRGSIVGLTCRVGRAVYGTIDIIQDLIESGKSVLILGRPGIGKTTILREAARILSEQNRVIIVDTSNEIGGDGDVPHPAVGRARRMQVATPSLQHEVMIEAVENHNPEVIIIDEIGRELEALAARTIAERGVQLIGTAHGRTLENLLLNPTLSDLVGGIEAVTLSDEEARRRGTQKTVLERRAPPTFDVLIEMQDRDRLAIQADVSAAVDALVRGNPLPPEIRYRGPDGEVRVEKAPVPVVSRQNAQQQQQVGGYRRLGLGAPQQPAPAVRESSASRAAVPQAQPDGGDLMDVGEVARGQRMASMQPIRIYPYGVARNRLMQSSKRLGVPAIVVKDLVEADALVTLRAYYRGRQQTILEAEQRGMPIYVLRANTNNQIEQLLADIFNLSLNASSPDSYDDYTLQTQSAIQSVLNGERYVDLEPATAPIRRMQHEMARQARLVSHSYGKEPNRRVRIYRE
jgi:stage III sporulation protein SpoIIIAA